MDYQNVSMALTILYDEQIQSTPGGSHYAHHGGPQPFALDEDEWSWDDHRWEEDPRVAHTGWWDEESESTRTTLRLVIRRTMPPRSLRPWFSKHGPKLIVLHRWLGKTVASERLDQKVLRVVTSVAIPLTMPEIVQIETVPKARARFTTSASRRTTTTSLLSRARASFGTRALART